MMSTSKGQTLKLFLADALIGEIIQMALSDHVSFADIRDLHGLGPDQVKALMRSHLSAGSYRSWRRRVRRFADRRATYK